MYGNFTSSNLPSNSIFNQWYTDFSSTMKYHISSMDKQMPGSHRSISNFNGNQNEKDTGRGRRRFGRVIERARNSYPY